MLAFLSPAKNMKAAALDGLQLTEPLYLEKAKEISKILKSYAPWQWESIMKVSPSLAMRAYLDLQAFDTAMSGTAALLTYDGLAYWNLNAKDFDLADFAFASSHLRMLSPMYGLLCPSDMIQPYRLEMQCKFRINEKNLYAFWGDLVYRELFRTGEAVINLASAEYSKMITGYLKPQDTCITCEFLCYRKGKLRMIAANAKMARGQMARFIVKNRLETPEELKLFHWDDYQFQKELSGNHKYVFIQG